jgi:hypothetical protein
MSQSICAILSSDGSVLASQPNAPLEIAHVAPAEWGAVSWPDGYRRVPIVREPESAFDPRTQELVTETVVAEDQSSVTIRRVPVPLSADQIAANLASARSEALTRIDAEAESCRAQFVTPGSGQAMSYLLKASQARAVLAGATQAPVLAGLVGVEINPATGAVCASLQEVAAVVAAQADAWEAIEGQIDALRRGGKLSVGGAPDVGAVDAVFPIAWPTTTSST